MNRKSLLGLILFAILISVGLFVGAKYLTDRSRNEIDHGAGAPTGSAAELTGAPVADLTGAAAAENTDNDTAELTGNPAPEQVDELTSEQVDASATESMDDSAAKPEDSPVAEPTPTPSSEEPGLSTDPSDAGSASGAIPTVTLSPEPVKSNEDTQVDSAAGANAYLLPQLIYDCKDVDYMSYIPTMVTDSELEAALNIKNPDLEIDANAAILFDAKTKKVLYYKNPVEAKFPASTAKLLTSLVTLQWCKVEEQVTIGDEIKMIASDSTRARLKQGQILTIQNLLEGLLVPSGNDAAYAIAVYVGRKSLDNTGASKEEAVNEFVRLMNETAADLGVRNSSFKTPDGYDAIGQYTTAYDLGLIGIAAAKNTVITQICQKSKARNVFVSGEDVTWTNTNKLVTRYSGQYYSRAIGLKTGTSTMAGKCLIAAAEDNGKEVVCVVLDSSSEGRWEDAIALLKYGLK